MSRSQRFIAGTLAGYGSIGSNILYTLLSVPLALAYLDKEHFGLWALAIQINGYLNLIELGMGSAINRHIADHKDNINGGLYGSHILTSGIVFIAQGAIMAVMGISFSWMASSLFSIPSHLAADFRHLLILMATLLGLTVTMRAIASPLWAFQRLDVINLVATFSTLLSLACLWLGFHMGYGIHAFPLATIPALIFSPIFFCWFCKRSGYFPQKHKWNKPQWSIFKKIFRYGKDVFLVQVGNQLLNASQIMIISKFIGLGAAATYAIATKIYSMGMLFLGNPISTAGPGLTEIYVRGDKKNFISRYWDLYKITLAASTVIAVGISTGNSSFIAIWTKGEIQWHPICDAILGVLLVFKSLNLVAMNVFDSTKNWSQVRYLYLSEAIVFILLAIFFSTWMGLVGVLFATLLAHLLTTVPIATRTTQKSLGSMKAICRPLLICILMLAVTLTASQFYGIYFESSNIMRLMITMILTGICALVCYKTFLPKNIRNKMIEIFKSRIPINIKRKS